MTDIIKIKLDNELDLILTHKRAMKLAELCGLLQSAQTRFATAVSEIARCSISYGKNSQLTLGINNLNAGKKAIIAVVTDEVNLQKCNPESFAYAGRLSKEIQTFEKDGIYEVHLSLPIQFSGTITPTKISSFVDYFKSEAPLSPYDEIRKKNIQLIELSEKLLESEANYRQLSDSLPIVVFSINNAGSVTVMNRMATDTLGKKFDTFTASSIVSIFHEDDYITISQGWDVAKRKGVLFETQVRLKTKDGYRWHILLVVPRKDEQERVDSWIVSLIDINAQKLVEETLKDNKELRTAQENLKSSNTELYKKNKELEQFAYVASHDLQEPLRKIQNFISLADRNKADVQKYEDLLLKIDTAAKRMSLLVRDILNYSTLTKNEQYEEVNLKVIFSEVLQDLELPIAEQKAVIKIEDLPVIKAIPAQINQLFYNLLSNALKFTDKVPEINISYCEVPSGISIDSALNEGPYFAITVRDNGIGIEDQYKQKIFSIFQRLHAQSSYQGTGIGLSLCKRIAENHHGTITVKSEPGIGSAFTVYLPEH